MRAQQASDVAVGLAATLESREAPQARFTSLFRELFNQVALSPHTQFTAHLTLVLTAIAERPGYVDAVLDTYSYMLRHLCRHLTAFDLRVFHNFGANYPDALFLDQLLKAYLALLSQNTSRILPCDEDSADVALRKRIRRRAVRQAVLVRTHYEGHLVPDAPTSMGENLRVLPPSFPRVSEAQITQPRARRKRLFEGDPTAALLDAAARDALSASMTDLDQVRELVELGTATFLARPLGANKLPGAVDRTPLVGYEALSRTIARRRLDALLSAGWFDGARHSDLVEHLNAISHDGVLANSLPLVERPGVVSLADAVKAAPDFVLIRSSASALRDLLNQYDLGPLAAIAAGTAEWVASSQDKLLVPGGPDEAGAATLRLLDLEGRCRVELSLPPATQPYQTFVEVELPARLRVARICEPDTSGQWRERTFQDDPVWLMLRLEQ
jgi:hypothetical protein